MRQITPALIQKGCLRDVLNRVNQLKNLGERIVLITDENVGPLHAESLRQALHREGVHIDYVTIPAGEETKTRKTKEWLEDRLFEAHVGRHSVLIAMGGGVITDLVGFLASTYCRGTSLVLIPTTLLAMCDAAIGGKTGVNVPGAKNRIGSFYPADHIWVDSECLNTLSMQHRREGIVEMVKHALIADVEGFEFFEEHLERILALESLYLEKALSTSIAIKERVVSQDLKESGLRSILNFGHTVGHALEANSNYLLSHGAAVAMGLSVEAWLSRDHVGLSQESVDRIDRLLVRIGLASYANIDPIGLIAAMQHDKKKRYGQIRSVLLEAIGKVHNQDGTFTYPLESNQWIAGMDAWKHQMVR